MSLLANGIELSLEQKRELVARLLLEKAGPSPCTPSLVHRFIEEQVGRRPDAVALVASGASLTYAELNARANRLARRLRAMGVGPEVLVGLCAGRTATTVVGLLAILKAGGAYVPLDPAYPAERIAFMLQDARASVLLTEERLRDQLPGGEERIVCLDSEPQTSDQDSTANLDGGASAANLAYVIYTSGSTGKPKGVQITHGALANLLQSMRRLLSINERDALLAVTTLSFDIAALEIFLPLIVGARVELIEREVAADGARLSGRLNDPAITFLQATPATWRLLLEAGWQGQPALKMLCGGEALPRALADRLLDKGTALWNVYGPTETTIWSSACRVEAGEAPISIGRPIANTQFYVLDKRLRAVPVGVIGELYIGGSGLARGYRHRAALTAERFIPDPFGATPGGRLYGSGDLARWRADGTLECLGRVDHQVKIRGFRVELGEIEAALAQHPGVREAAVAARPDASGEMSLAAYIVVREGSEASSAADLRKWLQGLLPDYMVPSAFVSLEALPLTPNGKVDRQALPDPGHARLTESADFVPPCGPVEAALAEIWTELLGERGIGAQDSFFEHGGHSLMAIQLLARVRRTFDVEVPLDDFLGEPTISRLARAVERALAEGGAANVSPLVRVPRDGPLPASFPQQRLWFLDQLEPGSASYNIPAAVRLRGQLDLSALERALNEVIRRHEVLRTMLVSERGIPRQIIADRLELLWTTQDFSRLPEGDRESQALRRLREEAERPFDLARGPLIRAALFRLSEQEHFAIVTMHHAVSDGWSIGILIRELSALYGSFRLGEPSPLAEPAVQYADYALWQRKLLDEEGLEAQLKYWKRQLAGVPQLELPTDRPRPLIASQRGGERTAILPKATLAALRALGRGEGATLYITLLAAFQVLLHRYSSQEDIAVGSPIAGRTRPELEGLIGFFVNTLVLRGDLSGDPPFRELLRRARRTAIEAYTHQDVPFEKLVSVTHADRESSRAPLFQVMFALQNVPPPELHAPELVLTPLELSSSTSKFDLTLFATEVPEGLRLSFEYSADLFDAATAERMLAHFQILLEEIIAAPDQSIGAIPMLTPHERLQVLQGFNRLAPGDDEDDFGDLEDDDLDSEMYEFSSTELATND
jgi:amino acid adenylation domain-containing protein